MFVNMSCKKNEEDTTYKCYGIIFVDSWLCLSVLFPVQEMLMLPLLIIVLKVPHLMCSYVECRFTFFLLFQTDVLAYTLLSYSPILSCVSSSFFFELTFESTANMFLNKYLIFYLRNGFMCNNNREVGIRAINLCNHVMFLCQHNNDMITPNMTQWEWTQFHNHFAYLTSVTSLWIQHAIADFLHLITSSSQDYWS